MATPTQITAAVVAFQKWCARNLDCELPADLVRWIRDPMLAALRAADEARPATIQDRDEVEREAGKLKVRIETWDREGNSVEEVLLASNNVLIADAAWSQALRSRPKARVTLRDGGRVIQERVPEN